MRRDYQFHPGMSTLKAHEFLPGKLLLHPLTSIMRIHIVTPIVFGTEVTLQLSFPN